MEFKESEIYKAGKFYEQYGLLLQNPNTTLDELVEFCFIHERKIEFGVYIEPPKEAE